MDVNSDKLTRLVCNRSLRRLTCPAEKFRASTRDLRIHSPCPKVSGSVCVLLADFLPEATLFRTIPRHQPHEFTTALSAQADPEPGSRPAVVPDGLLGSVLQKHFLQKHSLQPVSFFSAVIIINDSPINTATSQLPPQTPVRRLCPTGVYRG